MELLLILLTLSPIALGCMMVQLRGRRTLWRICFGAVLVGTVGACYLLTQSGDGAVTVPLFSGFGIGLEATPFGKCYTALSYLLFGVGVLASREYFPRNTRRLNRYYASILVTLGGTVGVFLAADLFTLFVFFEVMSFASYLWVVQYQDVQAARAGNSYLAFSVIGGLAMLFGLFLIYSVCPNLSIEGLAVNFAPFVGSDRLSVGCFFLFLGFGTKAGAFFLYDWLPLAYTASPAPASALLSAILSKTGLYGVFLIAVRLLPAYEPFAMFILTLGVLNMIFGGLAALFSSNLKRLLAFSSVSQVGFILWGIALTSLLGEHGGIAALGTMFHMVNHSIIKMLLFTFAGIVFQRAGTLDMNLLRGFGRGKPWLHLLFFVGAVSMSGVPLFAGYISKTLLHEAVVEQITLTGGDPIFMMLEWLFLFAGGCTLAYMAKLYICIFVCKGESDRVHYASRPLLVTLSVLALALAVLGSAPHLSFDRLGDYLAPFLGLHHEGVIAYFSFENLRGALLSISMGIVLYLASFFPRRGKTTLYSDIAGESDTLEVMIYRPLLSALSFLCAIVARLLDVLTDAIAALCQRLFFQPLDIPDQFYHGDDHAYHPKRSAIHITYSLSFSLLMFGLGLLLTLIALLVLGGVQV